MGRVLALIPVHMGESSVQLYMNHQLSRALYEHSGINYQQGECVVMVITAEAVYTFTGVELIFDWFGLVVIVMRGVWVTCALAIVGVGDIKAEAL